MKRLELAERIIELRERASLTQGEAAKRAGVGVTTWSNIETGTITRPHTRTIIKIARTLGVEPEELTAPKVAARPDFSELPGLTAARKRRGISRNELAARSGLAPSYVAELEVGAREATPDILERLAGALNASPVELGAPAAQYAAFLEEAKRDAERDNERVRQELDELSPGEMRALAKRALLEWPTLRKIHDALEESPERQSTEEAG